MSKIGIIGGGISGLTLAFLLMERGHIIRVFEATGQPGGAIKTTCDPQGWMAEWGPNTIIESSGRIKRLVSMLDLDERRCYPDERAKKRYIVRNHCPVPVPDSLSSLIRSPLLSKRAKWSLFREPFIRKRQMNHAGPVKEESVADLVRRRLGEEFLRWPIDALVGGIYAGNPENLSVRHAFPRLALLEEQHGSLILGQLKGGVRRPPDSDEIPRNKARIFSFDQGLQVLPKTLAKRLDHSVLYNTEVHSVSYHSSISPDSAEIDNTNSPKTVPHRWSVLFGSPQQPPEYFDVLIYAGTAHGIDKISFPGQIASDLELLTKIPHPPVVSLTLGFHRADVAHRLDGFGLLVPGVEDLPILGTLFPSSLFPGRSPGNEYVTLTTYLGGMRQPEIAEKSEETQIQLVRDTLRKILGVSGKPVFHHRILWPQAIPQYHLDHQKYLDAMDRVEKQAIGFYLVGNYRTGISVGDSINAAFDLADRIHEHYN